MNMPCRYELARRLLAGGIGLGLLGPAACTRFANEWDTVEGAVATELRPSGQDWSCVSDQVDGNPIMPSNGPPLDYAVMAVDFLSGMTPPNLRIRACYRGDISCNRPATEAVAPDAEGIVTLPLSLGFNGFLEIESDDMVPTLFVFPGALTLELAATVGPVPIALLPFQALMAFGQSSQLDLNPEAGIVSMNAYDCAGPNAAGVRLELNASAVPFAFVDGLPIAFQDTTTAEGTAGFANVLPGLVVVRGFRSDTSQLVGLETILVRTGWVTVGTLMPQFATQR